ncbi:MAG: prepilin-type N-terminal cleavage/methylation domain-containing protein, partial [Beijerinckiaceae bacterium]|nr:prepilin-type N-terminal cleavage/methylation domain-containing protein [Beijerinckiaceae bacterium]
MSSSTRGNRAIFHSGGPDLRFEPLYPPPNRIEAARSKSAFTIVELLVVVAIIALLVGILVPAI